MYKYPANLREKAMMGLWTLVDIVAITLLMSGIIMLLTKLGFIVPHIGTVICMLLSTIVNDLSIKDYLVYIFRFCVSGGVGFFYKNILMILALINIFLFSIKWLDIIVNTLGLKIIIQRIRE